MSVGEWVSAEWVSGRVVRSNTNILQLFALFTSMMILSLVTEARRKPSDSATELFCVAALCSVHLCPHHHPLSLFNLSHRSFEANLSTTIEGSIST
jgi:histone acetyltransferase (RNA polymerase elongator complex component)